MNTKQLLITGAVVAAAAKFIQGAGVKNALIIGGIAAVAAAVSDNLTR
jgi:hypothetical protein